MFISPLSSLSLEPHSRDQQSGDEMRSTRRKLLRERRKEVEFALKELDEKELDEKTAPTEVDSDGDETPPLRRLQKMLEDAKARYGDLGKSEVNDFGDVSEKSKNFGDFEFVANDTREVSKEECVSSPERVAEEVQITKDEGPEVSFGAITVSTPGGLVSTQSARDNVAEIGICCTGMEMPVLKSIGVGPLSWKNIVLGKGEKCDSSGAASGAKGDCSGVGSRTKSIAAECIPGARSNVKLQYIPFEPGSPVNNLVADAGTVEKLNNCIVGHFLGARMDFYDVRKEMFNQWEICGLEKMWCTDNGIYLFKFKATNRIDEILNEAHCHVFGKVMVLKRWHQMQKLSKEAVYKVPIWVKLYELPFEFWLGDSLGENLSKIASRIGQPLYLDIATEKGMRLSYARVCVEIDVSALLPNSINIEFGGESVEVKVKYQWIPQKCEKCGAFGHKESYCPLSEEKREIKSSKAKAPTGHIYGGRIIRGNGGKVLDKDWKVVQKGKWESRINSIINSEEELGKQEGNKWVCSDVHGKKAQVKGNLAKDKGHVKSGNSFAVLQSIQGENHGMNVNRGRKEVDAIGASRVAKTDGGEAIGSVGRDIFGDLIDKDSGSVRNPEEDRTLFEAFVAGKEADGLGSVTPKPKKIWTENDFPIEWGKSRRRKAAKAANLAGPVHFDPP